MKNNTARRGVLLGLLGLCLGVVGWLAGVRRGLAKSGASKKGLEPAVRLDWRPLSLPRDEWKKILPSPAFRVLFEDGTERAYSSPLNEEKKPGTYVCAACFLPLFSSETKYDSGTGWPSFWAAIEGRVGTKRDFKLILPRTEYHCSRCGGHQGHVFSDGPKPTGLRYCNNGVALKFIPEGENLPPLRMGA